MGRKARVDLVLDCAEPKQLADFWRAALDYRDYYIDANVAVLVPNEGIASPLVLQGVPEPKAGKNRMHLDIVVDDIEPEIARLRRSEPTGSTKACRVSETSSGSECRIPSTTSFAFAPASSGRG